jgi:curved DNA-binding protein CbpA
MSVTRDHDLPAYVQHILEWDRQLDVLDYYELLSVNRSVSDDELLDAYHRFALVFHPDAHPDCPPALRQALTRIFQRGVEAHQVLSNNSTRARYRELLARGIRRFSDSHHAPKMDLGQVLPTLHEHCRSAGAKLDAQQAARAWVRHEFEQVERKLLSALRFDGDANPDLEQCLVALRTRHDETQ